MEVINANPFIERSSDSIWDRANSVQDRIYAMFLQSCSQHGVHSLVTKSNPSSYPLCVEMNLWLPQKENALTARSQIFVTIQPKPYHNYEMEFDIKIISQERKKSYKRLKDFNREDIDQIVLYFLDRGTRPKFWSKKLRYYPFQLWLPKNKIRVLRRDWTQVVAWLLLPLLIIGPNYIPYLLKVSISILIVDIFAIWRLIKRPQLVLATDKPQDEPRLLLPFDSWQTVIFDVAKESENLRNKLINILNKPPSSHFRWKKESISYVGLDALEEREQYALLFNRGIFFVHIHQYGEGLYLGWDAYLNFGSWLEMPVAQGVHRDNGRITNIQSLVPGIQMCSEYDLADLNCLIEWGHGKLTKLIKDFLEEKKIDQEIDFKILRVDRDKVLSSQGDTETPSYTWRDRASVFSRKKRETQHSSIGSNRFKESQNG